MSHTLPFKTVVEIVKRREEARQREASRALPPGTGFNYGAAWGDFFRGAGIPNADVWSQFNYLAGEGFPEEQIVTAVDGLDDIQRAAPPADDVILVWHGVTYPFLVGPLSPAEEQYAGALAPSTPPERVVVWSIAEEFKTDRQMVASMLGQHAILTGHDEHGQPTISVADAVRFRELVRVAAEELEANRRLSAEIRQRMRDRNPNWQADRDAARVAFLAERAAAREAGVRRAQEEEAAEEAHEEGATGRATRAAGPADIQANLQPSKSRGWWRDEAARFRGASILVVLKDRGRRELRVFAPLPGADVRVNGVLVKLSQTARTFRSGQAHYAYITADEADDMLGEDEDS